VAAFLLITLSSIALPGMNGFIGEFLILLGGFLWNPIFAALAATGMILSAVYMLWMFQRVNYGEITNVKNRELSDLTPREWTLMVPTIAVAIAMGVFPNVFLRPMEPAVQRTIERVTGRSFAAIPAPPASLPSRDVAVRGASPAAFDGRGIPAGGARRRPTRMRPGFGEVSPKPWRRRVAPSSNTPGILGRRAWPSRAPRPGLMPRSTVTGH
jgi:hypothetical protein